MFRLRVVLLLPVLLALAAADVPAQVVVTEDIRGPQGMQMAGPAREFKTGTGRIRGRIITADTGGPVRRAQVRLSGPDVGVRTATTDAEGRYEFRDLPAGRFMINATKAGYVSLQYGQTRPFEAGKAIDLADGQALDRADIAMPRGSVIAGRIVDEFGEPVPDATVQALRSTWSNGRRRLQPTGRSAVTNDIGQYRLYGLPPGEYYVSATLGGAPIMQMDGGGAVTEMVAVRTVMAAGAPASASPAPTSGYAPTYYPGTTTGAEAQRVALTLSQELQGADFALVPVRLATVSGTVINSGGQPVEGTMVNLTPINRDTTGPLFALGNSGRTDRNGNFTINAVPPGDYTLQTRGAQVITSGGGDERRTMVFTMMTEGGGSGGNEPEVGSVPVTVAGDDVSHVLIMTAKGGRATGTVTFEGGSRPDHGPAIRVLATPIDTDGPAISMMGGSGVVQPDGSFDIGGLAGGRLIRIANVPQGWMLKGVRLNGQDITDTGAIFRAGEAVSGLEIVLTNRLTTVSGTVTAGNSEPVKDYTVVIFSDDPDLWTVPQSRHVTGVRPDQDGRFQARNLPAGSYYAIAVEYIEQGTWGDPDVLDRLKATATSFTLRDGEQKTLDLKINR
jgi:protocatechuate 3,4-dioxygenase beta subunit